MLSNYLLPKSEVCCAVAGCEQHSGNAIQEGYNVSFHGFPKILRLQKIWAEKCKIVDTWDPQLSYYVCSMHFGRDDFIHDLETELSGYVPSYRYLRQGITPTLNLPNDSEMSKTPIECNSSLIKTAQRIREVLARSLPPSFLPGTTSIYSLPPTTPSISSCDNDTVSHQNMSTSTDYKKLYNDTLNECNILKSENKQLLKKVEKKKKESNWTRDKVANAFALMYHSKRAYEYLKNELHYSLPEMSCFQQWAKAIVMNNGLIEDVLKIMKLNSENLKDHEKLTVLMFDEIKVYNIFNKTNDKVIGPYTNMHVVMALGIAANWKQPVFVDFNVNMTRTILYDIIDKLDDVGYKVICCVSNCSNKNMELCDQLELTYNNPYFFIPNGRKIMYIPDSLNLLKLVRNWLLDTGFCLNGLEINKKPLEALITKTSAEDIHLHLKEEHLTCEGPQRENFKLAKQLLSHNTAIALQHYRPIDDCQLINNTAEFIKLMSDWFNLTNVSQMNDSTPFNSPFGMFLYDQNKLLNEVYNIVNLMRCKGKNYTNLQNFQKGILMYINGIKQLLPILKENGLNYLLTAKINKSALNILFHQIYSIDNFPSPLNAVHILKMITLGKFTDIPNESNIMDNKHEEIMVAQVLKSVNIHFNDEDDKKEDSEQSDSDTIGENELIITKKDEMELSAIEFLAGWVALKYKSKIPEIGCMTVSNESNKDMIPSWMNHLSYNGLMIPSNDFKNIIFRVERLFNKFTKHQIPKCSNAKLTNKIFSRMSVEKKFKGAILTYIKQRIVIQMKYSNYCTQLKKKQKTKKINPTTKLIK